MPSGVAPAAEEHLPGERGGEGQLCPTHMLLCVMSGGLCVCASLCVRVSVCVCVSVWW